MKYKEWLTQNDFLFEILFRNCQCVWLNADKPKLKGSLQPKHFILRKCNLGPLYQDLQNIFSQKIFFPWVFGFPESKLHIFFHNCHILKPELLLHKTTTVQFVNSCGFKKQQYRGSILHFRNITTIINIRNITTINNYLLSKYLQNIIIRSSLSFPLLCCTKDALFC